MTLPLVGPLLDNKHSYSYSKGKVSIPVKYSRILYFLFKIKEPMSSKYSRIMYFFGKNKGVHVYQMFSHLEFL